MKRILLPCVIAFFIFFFFGAGLAFAVTTSISNVPSSISSDPFTFTVTVSGAGTGTNYLRVDLYKDGTTNYFGQTYNGSSWYDGSDHTQYFPISITSGTNWSGSIDAKFGSPNTTEYDGTGSYKLRVRRYTGSGAYNTTEANDGSVSVSINIPTSTPTPTQTPTPTNTPAPTAAPTNSPAATTAPTSTPTPTVKPTATPTIKPTVTSAVTGTDTLGVSEAGAEETNDGSVLGWYQEPTPTPPQIVSGDGKVNIMPIALMGVGVVFMVGFGILSYPPLRFWEKT